MDIWYFFHIGVNIISLSLDLKGVSPPHLTWMKTYQRVNSRGAECEPQQDPDWVGLVISRESTSESVPSARIMRYRMWLLCFEYLLYNDEQIVC